MLKSQKKVRGVNNFYCDTCVYSRANTTVVILECHDFYWETRELRHRQSGHARAPSKIAKERNRAVLKYCICCSSVMTNLLSWTNWMLCRLRKGRVSLSVITKKGSAKVEGIKRKLAPHVDRVFQASKRNQLR